MTCLELWGPTWLSDSLGTTPSVSARSLPKKERSMYSSADSVETHMWKCYLLSSLGEEQSPYIRCTMARQTSIRLRMSPGDT